MIHRKITIAVTTAVFAMGIHYQVPVYAVSGIDIPEEQVVFVPISKTRLEVVEVVNLQNYTSSAQNVQLEIPDNSSSLTVKANGARFFARNHTVVLKNFLPANGTNQVSLTFEVPYSGQGSINIDFPNLYSVGTLNLYVPEHNMEISAQNLMAATKTVTIGTTKFRVFTRLGIEKNENFVVNIGVPPTINRQSGNSTKLSGLPLIGQDSTGSANTWQAVLNLLLAGVILIIGFLGGRSVSQNSKDDKQ